jgi:GNAT superfamily N-acetyltransferase
MPPSVKLIVFDAATWRELGQRMEELERQEWGSRAFSRREMRWQATNRDAVVATAWDGPLLVGFAIAGPAWTDARASLLNVLIDPAYRGQGLVWLVVAEVERELFARGNRELEIDARVENGFADAVERRYGTRAAVIEGDHASPYGPQRTIRVKLAGGTRRPRRTRGAGSSRTARRPEAARGRRAARTRPPTR